MVFILIPGQCSPDSYFFFLYLKIMKIILLQKTSDLDHYYCVFSFFYIWAILIIIYNSHRIIEKGKLCFI